MITIWIARDSGGSLFQFFNKPPYTGIGKAIVYYNESGEPFTGLNKKLFPEIKEGECKEYKVEAFNLVEPNTEGKELDTQALKILNDTELKVGKKIPLKDRLVEPESKECPRKLYHKNMFLMDKFKYCHECGKKLNGESELENMPPDGFYNTDQLFDGETL
jgi:hypothetical protein